MTTLSILLFALSAQTPASAEPALFEPALFEPGLVSLPGTNDLGATFSPDGRRMAFVRWSGKIGETRQELFLCERTVAGWSAPAAVPALDGYRVDWPSFAGNDELLLSWCGPYPGKPEGLRQPDDFDLWRLRLGATRAEDALERLEGDELNRVKGDDVWNKGYVNNETGPQRARDGTLYFWSERAGGIGQRDLFRAEPRAGGGWGRPLPLPEPLNSARMEDTFLIDPDERWILFASDRDGAPRSSDLYLSERRADGTWSTPERLGPAVNSEWSEAAPALIDGGATLVFSSDRPVAGRERRDWNVFQVPTASLEERFERLFAGAAGPE